MLPTRELRDEGLALVRQHLTNLGLEAHADKTETIDFTGQHDRIIASKPLNYLGFTFDGVNKRIRPGAVARYYKKMRAGVARAKGTRLRVSRRHDVSPTRLRRRQLHLRYSYLGRHNFLSYAFDAARIMNDEGIKRQGKAHWKRLQAQIAK